MATIISEGAVLKFGLLATGSADTTVGQVSSLSISHSRDTIDVSNLATTGSKDHIAAKLYESELSCEVQLETYVASPGSSDGQTLAWDTFADTSGAGSTNQTYWSIELSDSGGSNGSKFSGVGFVTAFDVSVGMDSVVTASVTMKIDGAVLVTVAS